MNLDKLNVYELETLIELAKDLLNVKLTTSKTHHEIVQLESSIDVCPKCGHTHVVKDGHGDRAQHYLCRGCGTRFGATTSTFLFCTKLSPDKWIHFIACEFMHLSLRATAKEIKVSTTTCFSMRHKFYGALETLKKN